MLALRYSYIVAVAVLSASCAGPGAGGAVPSAQTHSQSSRQALNSSFSYRIPHGHTAGDLLLHNCSGTGSGDCLTPTTIRSGYNFSYVPGTQDGTGQTIVIVDAYGSPTISTDLTHFDSAVGLPGLNTPLQIVYPGGKASVNLQNAVQRGWAEETTLDVEWAHAAAPGATIVLVVSNNDQGSAIQSALLYAAQHYPNSAMSLSFGTPELAINGGAQNTQLQEAENVYVTAARNNVTVIASAGDLGATFGYATANAQYPASDPHVLGVGGTNLTLFHNGSYRNESVWNDGDNCISPCLSPNDGATGGAPSIIFKNTLLLPHQALFTGSDVRSVADVAYNASPDTGVVIYVGFTAGSITPGFYAVGGTSQGPPQYAGIVAVANQLRKRLLGKGPLGFFTDSLYAAYTRAQLTKTAPFHDVQTGDNVFPTGAVGFNAGAGYDYPTGLGSPNINNLLTLLVNNVP